MHFAIIDRVIQTGNTTPMLGTQGENNIEEVEFTISKTVGKADLSASGTKCVLYCITPDKQEVSKLLDFSELDESTMIAKWSVGRDETQSVGLLYVAIHFSTVFDNVLCTKLSAFEVARTIYAESPQPVLFNSHMASPGKMRAATSSLEPEAEAINIIGNKPIIPASLQTLAVQGDNLSKLVPIKMSRIYSGDDLSKYPISLVVSTPGGGQSIPLVQELTPDEITMIWSVKRPTTSYAGKISIQVQVGSLVTDTFCKITEIAALTISPSFDYEPITPVAPSEFEEYLAQIEAIRQQAVVAKDGAVTAKDAAVTKAGEASTSAVNASNYAKNAAASATNARGSEENAKKSETGAAGSLTDINAGLVSRLPISEANQLFKDFRVDDKTGIITFIRYDGTTVAVDTGLEKVVLNMRIDPDTLDLVLMLADGTEQRVSLVSFLNLYTGGGTSTADVQVNGTIITVSVKGSSIGLNLLTPSLQELINSKITSNANGNASQVKFTDGKTMQEKLDAGDLNGKDGVAIEQSGLFYMRVDEFGHLKVGVPDTVEPPPLSIRNGRLIYTIE